MLLGVCSHLFADEAHDVAARSWSAIGTGSPVRRSCSLLPRRFVKTGGTCKAALSTRSPCGRRRHRGTFSVIDYTPVIDFDDVDRALAEQSLAKLRSDLAQGYDHILMAVSVAFPASLHHRNHHPQHRSVFQVEVANIVHALFRTSQSRETP